MAEGVVENATAIEKKNLMVGCVEKLSTFYKAFRFRRSEQMSPNSVSREDLAGLIPHELLPPDAEIIGDTELHVAVRCGDSTKVDSILNHGQFSSLEENSKKALCRKRNSFGGTPLHEAVIIGHVEVVKILFSADEVVAHYPNKECKSPLYLAIENRNKEIVNILSHPASSLHIGRRQEQSSRSPTVPEEECDKIIRGLKTTEQRYKKKLKGEESQRQCSQSLNSYKAEGILAHELFQCIKEGHLSKFVNTLKEKCDKERLYLSDIVNGISPTGDTLLHMAVSFGKQKMVEFISLHFPQLLKRRNIRGDTALHVSATTRNLHNMIIIITYYAEHSKNGFYKDESEKLCRIRNVYGNTALHEAVMINNVEGASLLLSADKVVAHYLNKEGKSPLYLAVENENKETIDVLLHAPFDKVGNHQGNSPLHAAILKKISGGLMLNKLLDERPDLIQQRDQKGGTPFHCAASIGNLEGVRTFLKKRPLSALERNTKGYLPVHVASKKGHVKVVKEIVDQEGPDPLPLLNLRGQNILHIAAKNGKYEVVDYILREKKLEKLLNERDKNGNTPLHLASKNLFPKVLLLLTQKVEVNLLNNQCLSARDIVVPKRWEGSHRGRTILSSAILHSAGTLTSAKAFRVYRKTLPELMERWLKEDNKILMLVAILVATVTFAAGFTMPGGFISSDDNTHPKERGMAILVNRRMFQVFAICDAIAMYSSTIAAFMFMYSQLGDFSWALVANNFSLPLVLIALLAMSIAFMAGMHLVVASLSWLARAVIIIGTFFVSFFMFGFMLMLFPLGVDIPILRHISHILCRILIPLSGSYHKLPKKKKKETKESEQQLQKDETRQVRVGIPETQHKSFSLGNAFYEL